jgi:acyl-CoA oxidase
MSTLARRLKSRLDRGLDSFEALIEVQDHAIALAQAHTEFLVLEQFSAAADACEDPALAAILTQLCNLYALHRIHLDRGWFLEQGYLENNKSKAIRKLINRLCAEVRQQALPLVNAFGIPEACLAAPIARLT